MAEGNPKQVESLKARLVRLWPRACSMYLHMRGSHYEKYRVVSDQCMFETRHKETAGIMDSLRGTCHDVISIDTHWLYLKIADDVFTMKSGSKDQC